MIQFDEFDGGVKGKPAQCVACEELLADALDGSLGEIDQAWFDRHVQSCAECGSMLADAQRGAAWLELLKTTRPEPSALLMERILAQTSGRADASDALPAGQAVHHPQMIPVVAAVPANLLEFRPRAASAGGARGWTKLMFEPRLAMTAAMAFFSLALTMNLTGVKLNDMRLSDLKPANLKRSYYEANAQARRYYDNLRVVRVMESRVEDIRQEQLEGVVLRRGAGRKEEQPAAKPEEKKARPAGPGVSRREHPVGATASPRVQMVDEKVRRGSATAGAMQREGGLA